MRWLLLGVLLVWDGGNKADRWLPGLYVPTTEIVDRVRWEVSA